MKIDEESSGFETGSSSNSIFSGDNPLRGETSLKLESLIIELMEVRTFLGNLGTLGFFLS